MLEIWGGVDSTYISNSCSLLCCQYCICTQSFPNCLELGSLWS